LSAARVNRPQQHRTEWDEEEFTVTIALLTVTRSKSI